MSEKALHEVKSGQCLSCSGPLNRDRLVQLYPDVEVLQRYVDQLEAEHAAKKTKKAAKRGTPMPYQLDKKT